MGKFLAVASFHNNPEEHIDITFNNVLKQTHDDWILIVADDFSNDEDFALKLQKRVEELNDKRVIYYKTSKRRELYLYQNFFKWLDYDYYFDLDTDDILNERIFEVYDKHFQEFKDISCIFSDYNKIDEAGNLAEMSLCQPISNYKEEFFLRDTYTWDEKINQRFGQSMFGAGRCMRRPEDDVIKILKECKTSTDSLFLFYNLTRGSHLHIPRNLYTYIRREGSDSGKMSAEEHENFNVNANYWIDKYEEKSWNGPYNENWNITASISACRWIDSVDSFSLITEHDLEQSVKDRLNSLYFDKKIIYNDRKHENIIMAWSPGINLDDISHATRLSIFTNYDEVDKDISGERGIHPYIEDYFNSARETIYSQLDNLGYYYFFRQGVFTRMPKEIKQADTKYTVAYICANEQDENIPSLGKLVEVGHTTHIIRLDQCTDAFRDIYVKSRLDDLEPDIVISSIATNLLQDSTLSYISNNYWSHISSEEITEKNFKGDFIQLINNMVHHGANLDPIMVPKCTYHYRSGPELQCHSVPVGQSWRAEFWHNGSLVWKQDLVDRGWYRFSQDYWIDMEVRIVRDEATEAAYTLTADRRSDFGIQIDSGSLGDTLSWMGQVIEFKEQTSCRQVWVRCHKPFLFDTERYRTRGIFLVDWAQEWPLDYQGIGVYQRDGINSPKDKHPRDWRTLPLGAIAADQLGIDYHETRPYMAREFLKKKVLKRPTVCIATDSTAQAKYWNHPTGWQDLIDGLKTKGIDILYVSKEETSLKGVEHIPDLVEAAQAISGAGYFIGISSGLSWLAWAIGVRVCMISGFTWEFVEFDCDIRIINKSVCSGCWTWAVFDRGDWNWCPQWKGTDRHFECTKTITPTEVLNKIETKWFAGI